MFKKIFGFLFTVVISLAAALFWPAAVCHADGILIVDYPPDIPPVRRVVREVPPPSVKFHKVNVEINEQASKTSIDQIFINEFNQELEGTYIFPVPENATVSDFAMFIDGKRQSAELMDKDKARGIYEDIVRRRQDPALLEYMGSNMFKARVYPIPANGEKRIQLEYQEVLKQDSAITRYVYPLNTEKFSSKPLQTVSVLVTVKSKNKIKNVYSPSHKVDIKRVSDNEVKVSFEDSNLKPDKDFVLYYTFSENPIGVNVITHKPKNEDGYFMLMLAPEVNTEKAEKTPKNICFVLDTSGSMSGAKLKQSQNALKFCLNNLYLEDKFNIVNFSTEARMFENKLMPADKGNIEKALNYVDEIKAIGGTNINEAMLKAINFDYDTNKPSFIVFLTDGLPTIDVTDVPEILKNIEKANNKKIRIFCFGAGSDLNTTLLDRLSSENHGAVDYVAEDEDIEIKISNFYTKIASPVLTDINIDFGKIKTENIYPKTVSDIFKGSQVILTGRYRDGGSTAITVTGNIGGKPHKFSNDAKFPESDDSNNFLPRIWAQRRIGYLLEQIRINGENKELKDEVVQLSKKHGIMTPYTSFLVLEDNAFISTSGRPPVLIDEEKRRSVFKERVSSKMNSSEPGMALSKSDRAAYEQANIFAAPESEKTMSLDSGAGAVGMSRAVKKIQASDTAVDFSKINPESMKYAGAGTFFKRGDEWQISTYDEARHSKNLLTVKFGSPLYFKLMAKYSDAGKYCALGKKVLFEINGKFIRISDTGDEKAELIDKF
ncbi:MAG: VIT domain-containing protein [Candidatus Wallbacteria bacterium]